MLSYDFSSPTSPQVLPLPLKPQGRQCKASHVFHLPLEENVERRWMCEFYVVRLARVATNGLVDGSLI